MWGTSLGRSKCVASYFMEHRNTVSHFVYRKWSTEKIYSSMENKNKTKQKISFTMETENNDLRPQKRKDLILQKI